MQCKMIGEKRRLHLFVSQINQLHFCQIIRALIAWENPGLHLVGGGEITFISFIEQLTPYLIKPGNFHSCDICCTYVSMIFDQFSQPLL